MKRFLLGLLLGACAALIAHVARADQLWTGLIGLTVAVLVWFGEFLLDDLT